MKIPFRQLVNDTSPLIEIEPIKKSSEKPGMKQAFSELYQILSHCNGGVLALIPSKFLEFLQERRDPNWNGNLNFSINLFEMEMLPDTRVLIGMVYRDFLCSEEERIRLIEQDRMEAEASGYAYKYESLMDMLKLAD